jgi:hypothetical protein
VFQTFEMKPTFLASFVTSKRPQSAFDQHLLKRFTAEADYLVVIPSNLRSARFEHYLSELGKALTDPIRPSLNK